MEAKRTNPTIVATDEQKAELEDWYAGLDREGRLAVLVAGKAAQRDELVFNEMVFAQNTMKAELDHIEEQMMHFDSAYAYPNPSEIAVSDAENDGLKLPPWNQECWDAACLYRKYARSYHEATEQLVIDMGKQVEVMRKEITERIQIAQS